jgi:hypothetical protein
MKKIGILLFALLTVGFLATGSYAQHGGNDHGRDTTHHGGLDSTLLHHDNDSNDHHGKDSIDHRDTTNHRDTTIHHDGGKDSTNHGGRDSSIHHDGGKGGHGGDHGRVNIGLLLRSDSCRLSLEAQMSPADAAALEVDLAALKANADQIKTLLGHIRDARHAHDTATVHLLVTQLRALIDAQRTQAKAINDLLANYTAIINTVWHDCHNGGKGRHGANNGGTGDLRLEVKPLFPNPVSARTSNGGGQVTLMYSISADADVNITLSDAQGTLVQQVAMDHELAGQHQAMMNASALNAGIYIVRIQAGTSVQSQKLVVIQ